MLGTRGARRCAVAFVIVAALGAPLPAVTDRQLKSNVAELTPADSTADVTIVVAGDNRPTAKGAPPPRVLQTIFDEISLLRPALVLWTGDTVYGYCDTAADLAAEYDGFLATARRGAVPLFNVPGNHEIHAAASCPGSAEVCDPRCLEEAYSSRFGPVYGSFDYAGLHFVGLDSEFPGQQDAIAGEQLAWLRQDLEKNQAARAIFVFDHTEFYSSPLIDPGEGRSHPAIANRCALHDLFRNAHVRTVFSGHQHLYWREPAEQHDGIDYLVGGGAGSPLYTTPERGGFSHYILVRIARDKVSYDVIEPGHLYVEPAAPRGSAEARLWLVNSSFAGGLTLGGIAAEVPASLGACADLTAATELKDRNGHAVNVPIELVSCTAGGAVTKLLLKATNVPAGSSVPVVIRHR